MKRIIILLTVILFCISITALEREDYVYLLAECIAADMGGEPFVVRVAYGEMLLKRGEYGRRKKPRESDIRAAAAAYCNYGFSGGATNVVKWSKAENTPLGMRSGVRLYDWFFYI